MNEQKQLQDITVTLIEPKDYIDIQRMGFLIGELKEKDQFVLTINEFFELVKADNNSIKLMENNKGEIIFPTEYTFIQSANKDVEFIPSVKYKEGKWEKSSLNRSTNSKVAVVQGFWAVKKRLYKIMYNVAALDPPVREVDLWINLDQIKNKDFEKKLKTYIEKRFIGGYHSKFNSILGWSPYDILGWLKKDTNDFHEAKEVLKEIPEIYQRNLVIEKGPTSNNETLINPLHYTEYKKKSYP